MWTSCSSFVCVCVGVRACTRKPACRGQRTLVELVVSCLSFGSLGTELRLGCEHLHLQSHHFCPAYCLPNIPRELELGNNFHSSHHQHNHLTDKGSQRNRPASVSLKRLLVPKSKLMGARVTSDYTSVSFPLGLRTLKPFLIFKLHFIILYMCRLYVGTHMTQSTCLCSYEEVRRQTARVGPFLPCVDSKDWTQIPRLICKRP